MNAKRNIGSLALLALGVFAAAFALFLTTRGDGWFSFIFACPFWSAALLLLLAGFRFYHAALWGFFGALIVGGLAFIAGFLGPIIFMPNANQGPLFGIFVTGPLGSFVGTMLGWVAAIVVKRFRPQLPSE